MIDATMVVWLRVRPWTLLLPAWTLGFALAGPNPRFAPWRDAVLTLCLITVVFALRVPRSWPLPVRLALNSPGTAGVVLLVIAGFHDDGLGAAIRRRSWPRLIASLGAAVYGIVAIFGLLVSFGAAVYLLREPTPLRLLLLAMFLALNIEVLPAHLTRFRSEIRSFGCVGYVIVIAGSSAGAWPRGMLLLFIIAGVASECLRKLRQTSLKTPSSEADQSQPVPQEGEESDPPLEPGTPGLGTRENPAPKSEELA
ncbi:hypothetical protein EON81_28250 [bacterium]|nr:MAG: hypothetical protein EON81_28250 [bacterium]